MEILSANLTLKLGFYACIIAMSVLYIWQSNENGKLKERITALDNECKYYENAELVSLSKSLSARIETEMLKDQIVELTERNNKLTAQVKHKKYIPAKKHDTLPVTEYKCINTIRTLFIAGNTYERDTSNMNYFRLIAENSGSYVVNPLDFEPVKIHNEA